MNSVIRHHLKLNQGPVAILWSDDKPDHAAQFKPGKWGCVMWMLAAAARGKTAAFDQHTYGCWGGGVGLGFGNQYRAFPGGEACFHHFLSTGNERWEQGRAVVDQMKAGGESDFLEDFTHGERYLKSPELVEQFVSDLPIIEVPTRYVVLKPLKQVDPEREQPEVVVFWADPDALAALVVLANYARPGNENVIIPFAAGCQSVGIYAYREARAERPRAVVGQMDLSARLNVSKTMGANAFTFAVPWRLFLEMEENVADSFVRCPTWQRLRAGAAATPAA